MMTDPKLPRPYLENDTVRNRLVAITHERFSLQTVAKGSSKLFVKAMTALAKPVTRKYVLPGQANPNIRDARQRLAAMPKGTKGLFRKDGAIIVAGQSPNLLRQAINSDLDLTDIYLVREKLIRKDLSNAKLTGADFRLADLSRSTLNSTDITGADCRRTLMTRLRSTSLKAEGADFSDARMFDAHFHRAKLRGCTWAGTIIKACELHNADLRDCDFTSTIFKTLTTHHEYHGSRKWLVEMKGADLRGAKFSADTKFDRIDLSGAKLDGVIIVDRRGNPIPGATLFNDGSIMYSEIMDIPTMEAGTNRLPGPKQ
ncbi:MAG: hypothetical protein Alpg2KO_22390 [Alphaproteobacteria bacterium]